jgi:hypothetical protein
MKMYKVFTCRQFGARAGVWQRHFASCRHGNFGDRRHAPVMIVGLRLDPGALAFALWRQRSPTVSAPFPVSTWARLNSPMRRRPGGGEREQRNANVMKGRHPAGAVMVGGTGIEPVTYAMSTRRSTAELTARRGPKRTKRTTQVAALRPTRILPEGSLRPSRARAACGPNRHIGSPRTRQAPAAAPGRQAANRR